MRILHWTENWRPVIGGIEVLLTHLTQEQSKHGHEVAVVTDLLNESLPPSEHEGPVAIHRFPFHKPLASKDLRRMKATADAVAALLKTFRPEVIHLHGFSNSLWYFLLSQNATPHPCVVTIHTPLTQRIPFGGGFQNRIFEGADHIVAISKTMRDDLERLAPQAHQKSSVVWNGMPPQNIRPDTRPVAPPRVFTVGRLVEDKGFSIALQAHARWLKQYPELELWIAGDGSERSRLETLAREICPSGSYQFLGAVNPSQIGQLMAESNFVVVPSIWPEPFGLVALQAAQAGRPAIASNVGGLPEVVIDQQTGLLVPPGNIEALTAAGAKILSNPSWANSLGQRAKKHASDSFTIEACASRYDEIYQHIQQPN